MHDPLLNYFEIQEKRGGGALKCWMLQGCLFYNFTNGRGIQKSEELNGRDPKNEAPDQRVSKLSHEWERLSKFSALIPVCAISGQNEPGFVYFGVNFKRAS